MGQPRNRLTMFLIALLIAVAAAQNNYTIVNLYGNTACTGTPTATYTSNATAPCTTEKACGSNGYSQTCSATNGIFADEAANVCGFNLYPSGADCLTSSVSSGLRFVNTACHNVDSTDVSSPELAFVFGTLKSLCGIDQAATVKSVRTAGCFGAGTSPGFPSPGATCFSDNNCVTAIAPPTTTGTTSNVTFTTVVTTTPTQYQCRTCYAQGAVYSPVSPFVGFCGASFLQVSVAVIGLVVAFVAAL